MISLCVCLCFCETTTKSVLNKVHPHAQRNIPRQAQGKMKKEAAAGAIFQRQ